MESVNEVNTSCQTSNINVHEYDGSLNINLPKIFTKEEKLQKIRALIVKLKEPDAVSMLKVITIDLINDTTNNYDQYSKVDATDLLANILDKSNELIKEGEESKKENIDNYLLIVSLIDEQLTDMYRLGQCAQGRTTRLIQIWNTLE